MPVPEVGLTTSTVYTTMVYTITACPKSVTNCPVGKLTTDIVSLYTTVCPVSGEATSTLAAQITGVAAGFAPVPLTTIIRATAPVPASTEVITVLNNVQSSFIAGEVVASASAVPYSFVPPAVYVTTGNVVVVASTMTLVPVMATTASNVNTSAQATGSNTSTGSLAIITSVGLTTSGASKTK